MLPLTCAAMGHYSWSLCQLVGVCVCLSVRTFSLETWLWWIPNVDMWVGATGARHSKSLERRSQKKQRVYVGRLNVLCVRFL